MYQPKQPDSLSKGVTPMLLMDEVRGEGHVSVGGSFCPYGADLLVTVG